MSPRPKIKLYLVGYEQNKAHPTFSDDSGFWLRVKTEDAAPFMEAFRNSPAVFHHFQIEQIIGKEIRLSTLKAQIVEIEEGPRELRVLIRPDPAYGTAF